MRSINEWEYVTDADSATAWPHALPGENYVTYVDTSGGPLEEAPVAVLDLRTLETRVLFRGGTSPRYSPTGHLLFARGDSLYGVPFDPERARRAAEAFAELAQTNQVLVFTCHPETVELFKDAAPDAQVINM